MDALGVGRVGDGGFGFVLGFVFDKTKIEGWAGVRSLPLWQMTSSRLKRDPDLSLILINGDLAVSLISADGSMIIQLHKTAGRNATPG